MHITVDTVEDFSRRMRVEIPADRIQGPVDEKLESLRNTIALPGFRPGKVPLKLITHRYGAQARKDVLDNLIPETFREAIFQEKLVLASDPEFTELNDDPDKGMNYTVVFEVYPDLELPPLETLDVERPVVEITGDDVERTIEKLRKQAGTWSAVDRPAALGDRLVVDFEGAVGPGSGPGSGEVSVAEPVLDEPPSPEIASEDAPPEAIKGSQVPVELGAGNMLDGFEEGLVGARVDDERVLSLEFPEKYHKPELSGRPVTFTVRVRSVEAAELPETDEDLVRHFGIEDGGMDALRAATREDLEQKLVFALRMKMNQQVIGALLEKIGEIALPRSVVVKEAATIAEKKRGEFKAIGIEPDTLGISPAKSEPQARRQLTLGLLLSKLLSIAGITVDPARIRKQVENMASSYREPQQVIDWYYEDRARLAPVESMVLQDQLVEWVIERANVSEKPMSFQELSNA